MAYTTIKKPSDYFNTKLYTGTGASNSITGVGFQPDLTWIKSRSVAGAGHRWHDVVRGAGNMIASDTTAAEFDDSALFPSFDSDGFTVAGTGSAYNGSTQTYASWNWLASNTTASNTDGSITSTVSANTTSGFSIVTYTGTSSAETVGHGLGVAPNMIIVKPYSVSQYWSVFHSSMGNSYYGYLNVSDAFINTPSTVWNNTINSTVFGIGSGVATNINLASHIAYCFAEVKGFSKFGSYTGNGSDDGTFVYTGFKPAFVIIKSTSTNTWIMLDNKRGSYNVNQSKLFADANSAENTDTSNGIDFLSNGLKLRRNNSEINTSGQSYIYMAFAEEPLVGDNPATAR